MGRNRREAQAKERGMRKARSYPQVPVILATISITTLACAKWTEESRCERYARIEVACSLGPELAKHGDLARRFRADQCRDALAAEDQTPYLVAKDVAGVECADTYSRCDAWWDCMADWETKRSAEPASVVRAPPRPTEPEATSEGLERRARSELRLRSEGIRVNPKLPVIEPANRVSPRTKDEVVDRAIALTIVALKGEGLVQKDVLRGVERFGADSYLSADERAFIDNANPTESDRTKFRWHYEAAAVMMWALGFDADLASPAHITDAAHVAGLPANFGPETFRAKARLRSVDELLDEADLTYRYHWACANARLEGVTLRKIYCDVVDERHRALTWLIGSQGRAWDNVRTDT